VLMSLYAILSGFLCLAEGVSLCYIAIGSLV
jgi:hypothetical protein